MPNKRPRNATLAEIVASLPPAPDPPVEWVRSPAGREEFVDDEGQLWRKVRGPLHRRLTQRLATQADALIIGEAGGGQFRHVPATDRLATWNKIKGRLMADDIPSYAPYEFVSTDGLTLLYIEESC
ncbi:hypothetical protein ABZ729_36470 [Streptomyces sp. NPDC006678]|uniref:hypothetical protein n=1 Tax=Streptomyces sp. NPDC006678 TaxID=3157185 RepID=UPI0034073417